MTLPGRARIQALIAALPLIDTARLQTWGGLLAERLPAGGRLLVAGNGGSAAEAQHLTSELVSRFRAERVPLSAIALHADTSSVTAIANDYGPHEVVARQVRAHGRPGDILPTEPGTDRLRTVTGRATPSSSCCWPGACRTAAPRSSTCSATNSR